jgi:hypothetical protein
MQMKYFLHVLVMGMLFSLHAFSQSAIISYNNAPLPEICNTFNGGGGPFKLGGCEHYPYSGGVFYNHTDGGIALKTQAGNTIATNLGTAYAIKYAFKEGYYYSIEVAAWQADPSMGDILLTLNLINQLPDPGQSDPISCGGVNSDHWAPLTSNPLVTTGLTTNKSSQTLVSFTATQASNYLTVLAWQGAPAPDGSWAFISGIVIHEAPPTYTLAPTAISKTCGTGLSQTFTIADKYNSGKVSSYVWDLGADNNGWIYNGAAAPRYITTPTPSLDLTAGDCSTPANVTATANRPGGSYGTNAAVVTVSDLSYISGGITTPCGSTGVFTVNNLTCGANVNWSLSSGANGTLSTTTGPTTTLTAPAGSQHLTISANITSSCVSKTMSRDVNIITTPVVSIFGDIYCQDGRIVGPQYFSATANDAETFYWSWRSGTGAIHTLTDHSGDISQKFGLGSYTMYCYATNACGTSNTDEFQFNVNQCSLAAAEREDVAVSPNPASNVVVITTKTTTSALKVAEKQEIREVRIIDKTGILLRKQSFPAGTTTATINVESLKPDLYILQIGDGKTFKTRKITINR